MEKSIVGREKEKTELKEKYPDADEDLKTGGQIDLLIDRKVYVTPFGLFDNMYARKVSKQIVADDLFKKG